MRIFALIACGGQGLRAAQSLPKQYTVIAGKSVVEHTMIAFSSVAKIQATCILISPEDAYFKSHIPFPNATFSVAACAGSTRDKTVLNGLNHLLNTVAMPQDWVLVQDAARCLITSGKIDSLIEACASDAVGGLLAYPVPDTLKTAVAGRVVATLDRSEKWLAQTPQMFRIGALAQALRAAGDAVTDEASAMEQMGHQPLLVLGSAQNFKLTYPEDFALAEALLLARMKKHEC